MYVSADFADYTSVSDTQSTDSFHYVTIISSCFGVMPVHVVKGKKAIYHILGLLTTLLYTELCIYFCVHPFVIITHSNEVREQLSDWLWKLDKVQYTSVLSKSIALMILLIQARKISKLGGVIQHIAAVDELLITHNILTMQELQQLKHNEVKYFLLVIFFCIVVILGSSIFMTLQHYTDSMSKVCIILQDLIPMCVFCVELQFHALVMIIKHRFDLVNNDIALILHTLPSYHVVKPQQYCHGPYRHHKLYTVPSRLSVLTHIHHLLMAACIKSNKIFQFQMLLDLFITCVLLMVNFYAFMFQVLYTNLTMMDIFSIWPIHHTVKLILVAYSGHVIKQSIYTTKGILSVAHISTHRVGDTLQDFILREVEVYLMVLNNSKFNHVSLCGLINVDLSMLLKIFNATCTYVLIMLQYRWNVF